MRRRLGEDLHSGLCSAWRLVVARCGKGIVLARYLEVPEGHLSEWGTPGSGRSPSVAAVLEAEMFAGAPFVTAALAEAQGYRLEPIDGAAAAPLGPLNAAVVREMGEALTAFAEAAADGRLTARERARVAREFDDLARAAGRMAAAARAGK